LFWLFVCFFCFVFGKPHDVFPFWEEKKKT